MAQLTYDQACDQECVNLFRIYLFLFCFKKYFTSKYMKDGQKKRWLKRIYRILFSKNTRGTICLFTLKRRPCKDSLIQCLNTMSKLKHCQFLCILYIFASIVIYIIMLSIYLIYMFFYIYNISRHKGSGVFSSFLAYSSCLMEMCSLISIFNWT